MFLEFLLTKCAFSAPTVIENCGTTLTCSLDAETGILSITGTGVMADADSSQKSVFYPHKNDIKSIIIGDGVTSVGKNAFGSFYFLESVVFGADVATINDDAFKLCSNLTELILNENTKTIGAQAFSGCTSLKTVQIIGKGLTIGKKAFVACKAIENVKILVGLDIEIQKLFPDSKGAIKNVELPQSTQTLPENAFQNLAALTKVTNLETVAIIPQSAFENCTALSEMVLEGTTEIAAKAFKGCTSLEFITLSGSATAASDSFDGCTASKTVYIITGFEKTFEQLFGANSATIKIVNISTDIASITATKQFEACTAIEEIHYYGTLQLASKDLGIKNGVNAYVTAEYTDETFGSNDKVKKNVVTVYAGLIYGIEKKVLTIKGRGMLHDSKTADSPFKALTGFTSVKIEEGVTTIGSKAFKDITLLEEIQIPSTVKSIGDNAFDGCTKLEEIEIPDSVESVGNDAFSGCTKLAAIDIPDSVETIGNNAFKGCTILGDVVIPESVETIGTAVFDDCGIVNITLPGDIDYIFTAHADVKNVKINRAFEKSVGDLFPASKEDITTVGIEEGIESFPEGAFVGISSISELTIPESVVDIKNNSFTGCTSLKTINYQGKQNFSNLVLGENVNVTTINVKINYEGDTFGGIEVEREKPAAKNYDEASPLSGEAIAGIIVAVVLFVTAIIVLLVYFLYFRKKWKVEAEKNDANEEYEEEEEEEEEAEEEKKENEVEKTEN